MSVISGVISIKDNASAVLRSVKNEQSAFRKDVESTKKALTSTWDKKHTAKLDSTAAAKGMDNLKRKLEPLRKKIVTAVALKDMAKDKITAVGNKVKALGKMVAKPLVKIKDATAAGLKKIGGALKSIGKAVAIPVAIAGIAAIGLSIGEGAKLEQSIGGVETLFKGDASIVKANADKAFQTAGLSANEYMENVTSFSASLLNSVAGDTTKAAAVADMAMIDMADNANKFGTDMESIQTAYQGFAKQNYTMLDNLKLGYGGTKEEMNRLLKDAGKLTGVKYDINNLADVYDAIHAIQDDLGVTGTTAKEASETFSGSFASMKAAAQNLLGNLAIGGDISGSMESLVDSAFTFLFDNAIPMVGRIVSALPDAIKKGIEASAPKIKTSGGSIIKSLKDGMLAILPSSMGGLVDSLFDIMGSAGKAFTALQPSLEAFATNTLQTLSNVAVGITPVIQSVIGTVQNVLPVILPVISTVLDTIGNLFVQAAPLISFFVEGIGTVISTLAPVFTTIFGDIANKVGSVIEFVSSKMGFMQDIFSFVMPLVADIFSTAWTVISPIVDIAIAAFKAIFNVVEAVFPAVQAVISSVWDFIKPIVEGIGDVLGGIADGIGWVADKVGGWLGIEKKEESPPEKKKPPPPPPEKPKPTKETVPESVSSFARPTTQDSTTPIIENITVDIDPSDFPYYPAPANPSGGGGLPPPSPSWPGATPAVAAPQTVEQHIDQSVTVTIASLAGSITIKEELDIDAAAETIGNKIAAKIAQAIKNNQPKPATT